MVVDDEERTSAPPDLEPAMPGEPGVRLTPAIVLPAQVFGRPALLQPEKRLMLAVLEDAVAILLRPHARTATASARQLRAEAEAWLASDDVHEPFAYLRICEMLNLEPGTLRRRLQQAAGPLAANEPPLTYTLRWVSGARHVVTR